MASWQQSACVAEAWWAGAPVAGVVPLVAVDLAQLQAAHVLVPGLCRVRQVEWPAGQALQPLCRLRIRLRVHTCRRQQPRAEQSEGRLGPLSGTAGVSWIAEAAKLVKPGRQTAEQAAELAYLRARAPCPDWHVPVLAGSQPAAVRPGTQLSGAPAPLTRLWATPAAAALRQKAPRARRGCGHRSCQHRRVTRSQGWESSSSRTPYARELQHSGAPPSEGGAQGVRAPDSQAQRGQEGHRDHRADAAVPGQQPACSPRAQSLGQTAWPAQTIARRADKPCRRSHSAQAGSPVQVPGDAGRAIAPQRGSRPPVLTRLPAEGCSGPS